MSKRNQEEDKKLIVACLEVIMKSKSGKALVEFALDHDVQFGFDDHQKSMGYFSPQHNAVVLNGKLPFPLMIGTAIHEMRHAFQHHNGFNITTEYSPEDMVFMSAVMEADAEANHAQIAKELSDVGHPEVMEEHLKTTYGVIQEKYNAKIEETNDANLAKKEAFDAWFGIQNIRNGYAHDVLSFAFYATMELASQAKKGFVQLKSQTLKKLGKCLGTKGNYLAKTKLYVNKYKSGGLHKRFKAMITVFLAGLKSIVAPKNVKPKVLNPLLEHKMR